MFIEFDIINAIIYAIINDQHRCFIRPSLKGSEIAEASKIK